MRIFQFKAYFVFAVEFRCPSEQLMIPRVFELVEIKIGCANFFTVHPAFNGRAYSVYFAMGRLFAKSVDGA